MKINKFYMLLMLMFSLLSCSQNGPNSKSKYDYYTKGETFIKNEVSKFVKQNDLILNAYGINIDNDSSSPEWNAIHDFYFTFYSLEKVNLQQARKVLINCIENLLNEINNNKELGNYLYTVPFTYKNLDLGIFFFNKKGRPRNENYIYTCAIDEDTIYYKIAYPNGTFKRIHEETYDEALKIVEREQSKASKIVALDWLEYLYQDKKNEILHFCESDGNIDTRNALKNLSEKDRERLNIVGIASAGTIEPTLAENIYHFAAREDIVDKIYFENQKKHPDNVSILDSCAYTNKLVRNLRHPIYEKHLKDEIRKFEVKDK
ncbi:MAG: hypothetical protein KR126chlam4_01489 [Candidatus Anoxychlamydiales bacterium]|nr:hypothetical protein [Candidatus Anoxychlamydiales bacterium]